MPENMLKNCIFLLLFRKLKLAINSRPNFDLSITLFIFSNQLGEVISISYFLILLLHGTDDVSHLGMTTTRLLYTDPPSGELETPGVKGNGKIVVANYTISNQALKSGRLPTTVVGNMRLS